MQTLLKLVLDFINESSDFLFSEPKFSFILFIISSLFGAISTRLWHQREKNIYQGQLDFTKQKLEDVKRQLEDKERQIVDTKNSNQKIFLRDEALSLVKEVREFLFKTEQIIKAMTLNAQSNKNIYNFGLNNYSLASHNVDLNSRISRLKIEKDAEFRIKFESKIKNLMEEILKILNYEHTEIEKKVSEIENFSKINETISYLENIAIKLK